RDASGLLSSPQLVIPGGPSGSTLLNLSSLQLTSVTGLPNATNTESNGVVLSGNVANPGTYLETQLPGAFPTTSVTVCSSSRCSPAGNTSFNGIPLATFIGANNPNLAGQVVVGKATDGYEVVYSLSELLLANGTADPTDLLALSSGSNFPRTIL